jgi:hypothetical protein
MARRFFAALILGFLPFSTGALAQTPNIVTREATTTARVEKVEKSARVVTLLGDGNLMHVVYVDPSVKAFDNLRVGDRVTVRYLESAVVRLRRGAKLQEPRNTTDGARKAGNDNVMDQQTAVVKIENVDSQGQTVTYRTSDNRKMIRIVQDKKLLEGLRPGDEVEVTLTYERAVSIEPAR